MHGVLCAFYMSVIAAVNREMVKKDGGRQTTSRNQPCPGRVGGVQTTINFRRVRWLSEETLHAASNSLIFCEGGRCPSPSVLISMSDVRPIDWRLRGAAEREGLL